MDFMQSFFDKDRFANHVGIELLEVAPGRAKASLTIGEHHLNAMGIVHGAAIFSLADLVFAMASNAHGTMAVALNVSISFFKAVSSGTLTAEATEVSRNPRIAAYTIRISDARDDEVALFQGMVYRKKERLDLG